MALEHRITETLVDRATLLRAEITTERTPTLPALQHLLSNLWIPLTAEVCDSEDPSLPELLRYFGQIFVVLRSRFCSDKRSQAAHLGRISTHRLPHLSIHARDVAQAFPRGDLTQVLKLEDDSGGISERLPASRRPVVRESTEGVRKLSDPRIFLTWDLSLELEVQVQRENHLIARPSRITVSVCNRHCAVSRRVANAERTFRSTREQITPSRRGYATGFYRRWLEV
jgi:hypothetical protein